MSRIAFPTPEPSILARRDEILAGLDALLPKGSLIRQADELRAFETDALTAYIFAKAFVPLIFIGGSILLFWFKSSLSLSPKLVYLLLGISVIFGIFGTDMVVKNAGDNRIKKLTRALPDALDGRLHLWL